MKFYELFDLLANTTEFSLLIDDEIVSSSKCLLPQVIYEVYEHKEVLSIYIDKSTSSLMIELMD